MKTIRLLFSKTGMVKYISHLDLQRTMMRALVRSELPVKYSEGFNPHVRVAFALPLSVGTESVCELMDIKLEDDISGEKAADALNGTLPRGIRVREAYEPVTQFKEIAYACYEIEAEVCPCEPEKVRELFTKPVILAKRTKSGVKDTDISPDIHSISIDGSGGKIKITAELSASAGSYLNPSYILKAMEELLGVEVKSSSITRREVLAKSGGRFR